MTAWGYEFYLLVLKVSLIQRSIQVYFQHEKIKFVSPSGHVISSIYYLFIFSSENNLNKNTGRS